MKEELLKLEIFSKRNDFETTFNEFRNKYFFHREDVINDIIGEKLNFNKKIELYGSIYNSHYISEIPIKDLSHRIHHISKINKEYYGHIELLNTPCGDEIRKIIDGFGDIIYLGPVYNIYPISIHTLNIVINRSDIYKKILNRK